MKTRPLILIANADHRECALISDTIAKAGYRSEMCHSLPAITTALDSALPLAVVMDIDTIDINNRAIVVLSRDYPQVGFLITSSKRFHPDLKEALRHHIYACLNKPIDPDELRYWLRCIETDGKQPLPDVG